MASRNRPEAPSKQTFTETNEIRHFVVPWQMDRVTRKQKGMYVKTERKKKGMKESGWAWWWINRISFTSNTLMQSEQRVKGKTTRRTTNGEEESGGKRTEWTWETNRSQLKLAITNVGRSYNISNHLYFYPSCGFSFLCKFACLFFQMGEKEGWRNEIKKNRNIRKNGGTNRNWFDVKNESLLLLESNGMQWNLQEQIDSWT